jgi:hypothetical protein
MKMTARRILQRLGIRYTLEHGSWLDMAGLKFAALVSADA